MLRHGKSAREFLAFLLKDGRMLAGMNANIWDQGDDIKALIRGGAPVDAESLADASVPLADLA